MSHEVEAPTGLVRRRPRLSEEETPGRMLRTAVAMLSREGLTVGLDRVSMEEVIREAGVSRSAVYRRWPYKDLFFRDVVIELARTAVPGIFGQEVGLLQRVVAEHEAWLKTSELRTGLVVEIIRQLASLDFGALHTSPAWRTYLILNAAFLGIADDEAREQVRAALAESERVHIAKVAETWKLLTGLFGFRLRPDAGASFETLAILLDASMRGLVLAALSDPDIASLRVRTRPFGAVEERDWSLPALSFIDIAWGALEPDPAVVWGEEQVAAIRETMRAMLPDGGRRPGASGPDAAAGASQSTADEDDPQREKM